jgi:hypothetical protein
MSLKGSVCLYQGEELGLPQSDINFEELTDPPGIRFWPEYKGRDGCRTPIPWEAGEPPNGFTTGKPWLPVKPPQAALNVAEQEADPESMLAFYRRLITWRKGHDALVDGDIQFFKVAEPVLAYRRTAEAGNLLCIFNLSPQVVTVTLDGLDPAAEPDPVSQRASRKGRRLTLGPNGYAFIPESGAGATVKFGARRKGGGLRRQPAIAAILASTAASPSASARGRHRPADFFSAAYSRIASCSSSERTSGRLGATDLFVGMLVSFMGEMPPGRRGSVRAQRLERVGIEERHVGTAARIGNERPHAAAPRLDRLDVIALLAQRHHDGVGKHGDLLVVETVGTEHLLVHATGDACRDGRLQAAAQDDAEGKGPGGKGEAAHGHLPNWFEPVASIADRQAGIA